MLGHWFVSLDFLILKTKRSKSHCNLAARRTIKAQTPLAPTENLAAPAAKGTTEVEPAKRLQHADENSEDEIAE